MNTNLRKAAEMALEAMDDVTFGRVSKFPDARKALRQALAQPDEVLAEREACAKVCEGYDVFGPGTRERFAEAIRARSEKPPVKSYCGGKPNYCTTEVTTEVTGDVGACVTCGAPKGEWLVDAVNMSQERVDETAKREHEPWPSVQCVCGGTIYFKYTKREWVGLTDDELPEGATYEFDWGTRWAEAKLKEKNGWLT